jgi:hypothetical protein
MKKLLIGWYAAVSGDGDNIPRCFRGWRYPIELGRNLLQRGKRIWHAGTEAKMRAADDRWLPPK